MGRCSEGGSGGGGEGRRGCCLATRAWTAPPLAPDSLFPLLCARMSCLVQELCALVCWGRGSLDDCINLLHLTLLPPSLPHRETEILFCSQPEHSSPISPSQPLLAKGDVRVPPSLPRGSLVSCLCHPRLCIMDYFSFCHATK